MNTHAPEAGSPHELVELRNKITELVAKNALSMVQHAIDSVCEKGQYQAMKFLFEMIGLYPAAAQNQEEGQDALSRILLAQLGFAEEEWPDERGQTN
ncbi:MAG TPA: hypothetical protein VFA85_09020 [Terriglobales bacterium]|nr:hypothetical protein [Terriglobales bacterium]